MSDKTREQVRKDFESQILKSIKYANLERDALSDYISQFTLASWQSWQAANEMYAPKCERITDLERRNGELEKALTDLCHGCEQSFDWQYDPEFTKEFNAAFAVLTQHPQGESNGR